MEKIIKIEFKPGFPFDEVNCLNQWDQGKKLEISGLDVSNKNVEVHFSLTEFHGDAKRVLAEVVDGVIHAKIPVFIMEGKNTCNSSYGAYAWVYVSDEELAETIGKIVFTIQTRAKPADYVSPNEVKFLDLEEEIKNKVPIPSVAKVGQAIVVKAVDEKGKPTEFEVLDVVKFTDYAITNGSHGLVKIESAYGIHLPNGASNPIAINMATNEQIDAKTSIYRPIVPANLDYAIKKALSDCKLTGDDVWTDEEKTSALEQLGGMKKPATPKTPTVITMGANGNIGTSRYTASAIAHTIVQRNANGAIVTVTPSSDNEATTKQYVDTITKQYVDKSAPFIATYGDTTYEELLEAYRSNRTLLVKVANDGSNSELTGVASEIIACLSRVDGLGVQMADGDYGFVSATSNLATFSLRNFDSFDKTLLSMKVKFASGTQKNRIDIAGSGAWTGLSVYEEGGNLVIKDLYGMTTDGFYQVVAGTSFLNNEFTLQLSFEHFDSTSTTQREQNIRLGVYINGKLYNNETFTILNCVESKFGNCMSLYREVADSVITVNSVTAEDENVVTLDGYQTVTISDFIEGTEKESPIFTFTADENGVSRYYQIDEAKKWKFWNYKYADNITNHDVQILGLMNKVGGIITNTNTYNSFRGGFRNTAGTLSIKAPGIYFVLQGGSNNKTIKITQPDNVVEITKNGFIILVYENGVGTVLGISGISLTSLNPIEIGTYQMWVTNGDARYHTEISYPATTMISYLGNDKVDVGTWN